MKKYILPAVLLAAGFSLSTIGFQKQEIKAAEESGTEAEETSREQVKISPTEGNQMAGTIFFLSVYLRRNRMGASDLCAGRYAYRWRAGNG